MTTDTAVQLKPCPFCGGRARMLPWVNTLHKQAALIECCVDGCPPAPSVYGETPERAAEAWNTRATIPSAPLDPDNERLREALQYLNASITLYLSDYAHATAKAKAAQLEDARDQANSALTT